MVILPLALSAVRLPTEVKLDATTVEFRVVPVRVAALAVTVALPPSDTLVPLTVKLLLARYAFWIGDADQVPVTTLPTDVRLELTIVEFNVFPVNPLAEVLMVTEPPKLIAEPLMVILLLARYAF